MAALLPHRDRRRRESRVGKGADGYRDVSGKAFVLPVNGRTACRTEMKGQHVAALGYSNPRRSFTCDGDLFAGKARLVAEHGAGAPLALEAVAHGDAHGLPFNREVELAAAAGGASGGH